MRDTNSTWQKILAQGFDSSAELLNFLNLPGHLASGAAEVQFKTRVPRSFAQRMQPGNLSDPLLLQVLAQHHELDRSEGYSEDPLQEKSFNAIKGLIHKYFGRVLLTLTGTCAINCRYCFRRHFPYQENNPGKQGWGEVFHYINANPSLHEVIFSGGDPLLANDHLLEFVLNNIQAIPHVKTVRFHTRIPIVLPERIDANFVQLLEKVKLKKVIVVHCNHPNEIDAQVEKACKSLSGIECVLLNQSVLLKGVNDSAATLAALSHRLFACGIIPYYLHTLDKVQGGAHFDLPMEQAQAIYHELQSLLSGYLVPKLACEEPGQPNKTLI